MLLSAKLVFGLFRVAKALREMKNHLSVALPLYCYLSSSELERTSPFEKPRVVDVWLRFVEGVMTL